MSARLVRVTEAASKPPAVVTGASSQEQPS
jgi:hypothetical protein